MGFTEKGDVRKLLQDPKLKDAIASPDFKKRVVRKLVDDLD